MSTLGDSFDPLGTHLQDPHPFYARARKEEPVFYSPRMNAWVVTRHDDIFTILRDTETFSNANAIRTLDDPPPEAVQEFMTLGYPEVPPFINADGELHKLLRAPYSRNFAASRIKAAEPFMHEQVNRSLGLLAGRGRAELMQDLIRPLPIAVITYMYDIEEVGEAMVKAGTRGLFAMQGNLLRTGISVEEHVEAVRGFVHLCQVVRDVVYQRRAEPRENDLVSELAAAVVPHDQPMTLEQESLIVFNLAVVYLPGHVTTAPQLGKGIRHLLTHRDQWELLCQQPDLIPQAVEEFCRYDSSVTGMFRVARKATAIAGQDVPAGGEIFLALPSANRDEAFCERPDEFDITREPTKHLAFGYGAHYCIGAETGRREMRIALELLTQRLPGLRLADRPVEIEPVFITHGPLELHVEW